MEKKCKTCEQVKPLQSFVVNKGCKDGHTNRCLSCEKEWRSLYYKTNRDHITNRNSDYRKVNGMWYNKSIDHRLRYVIQLGIKRAKKKNIEWNLSLEFLHKLWEKQQGVCVYSGVPLTFEDNHSHTVSLDRLDSSKGYTEDNVQFVCTIVNYIKQRFDENHFLSFCSLVTQNSK